MSKLTKKKEPKTTQLVKQNKINIADFSVEQRLELVTQDIQDVQPKIDFYDAVANSKDYLDIQQVSALLAYEGYGQNNLFKYLRKCGVLINRPGIKNVHNTPYREYIENKCLKKIEQTYVDGKGNQKISCKTLVSQKGLEFIRRLLNDEINGE